MERRRHKRVQKALHISWRNEAVTYDGVTLDISPLGVFVITNCRLPAGSVIDIELRLDSESRFRCQGKITWVNSGQFVHYPAGFGVQFLNLEKESIARLLLLCCSTIEQKWPLVSN